MKSTVRWAWIIGFFAMTFGYLWAIIHGFDFAAATLAYGPFIAGSKAWEKFLGYKYGEKDASQSSSSPV